MVPVINAERSIGVLFLNRDSLYFRTVDYKYLVRHNDLFVKLLSEQVLKRESDGRLDSVGSETEVCVLNTLSFSGPVTLRCYSADDFSNFIDYSLRHVNQEIDVEIVGTDAYFWPAGRDGHSRPTLDYSPQTLGLK